MSSKDNSNQKNSTKNNKNNDVQLTDAAVAKVTLGYELLAQLVVVAVGVVVIVVQGSADQSTDKQTKTGK